MSRAQYDLSFAKLIGKTPCTELQSVSASYGYRVFGKLETQNPTGSHKDRENLEVIRDAISKGFREVGCASTGNAAISLAALSRMARLICHIFVSTKIAPDKLSLIRGFRPVLHVVRGTYAEAVERSTDEMNRKGIYVANPGQSIAKIEGDRNIGREVAESIKPAAIVCPTNNGTHFIGVVQGIGEKGLRPIAIAATASKTNVADSISGFHKYEGHRWEESVKQTNARVVDVSDPEIIQALRLLLQDGIIAEPAAASGIAALRKVRLPRHAVVCCTITGSGMKFPRLLENRAKRMY